MSFHFIYVFPIRKHIFKAGKIIHRPARRKRIGQKLNFDPHFDRAVNCQPSYRAWPRIAEARASQPSIYYSFSYFFDPDTPIFTQNPYKNAKNFNFFKFLIIFLPFKNNLPSACYSPFSYDHKLILSQMKVPYVYQFLRKFQLDIINLCSHTNQKCQSKFPKVSRPLGSRGIPTSIPR